MEANQITWVFAIAANELRCDRCGKHEKLADKKLPVDAYMAWLQYAALKHVNCIEAEKNNQ